ncbi:hypothetical protein SDC9_56093 [bioreactor metagenome]|uniref:Uncharacterized protein n=1 Tax=bioreactor metagenome TaxID=1076179 RepID=A0A644X0X4_9ZZZZ
MSERSYVIETLSGLKEYVSGSSYNCKGELFAERDGFLVEAISYGHTYYIKFIVNPRARVAMIEVSPGTTCAPCYQRAFDTYVSPLNDVNMIFKFLRSETGRVYLYYSQSLSGGPVTAEEFNELESRMILYLMAHMENLEHITHGDLPGRPRSAREIKAEIKRINREQECQQRITQPEEEEEEDTDEQDGFSAETGAETEATPGGSDYFDRAKRLLAKLAAERYTGPGRLFDEKDEGDDTETDGDSTQEEPRGEDGIQPGQDFWFGGNGSGNGPTHAEKALADKKNTDAVV